ncbi:MAG: ABC transporter ATP-binding protein [Verrucomicrobiae bacterium]|nr:ABC transporter ATP-binding protein [Verrucomicrobiae bacterium]
MSWSIQAEHIGKRYRRGEMQALSNNFRAVLMGSLKGFWPRWLGGSSKPACRENFYALKDIGFEIGQGELVGIVGRNGAGKSTLLKIFSRITPPSEGIFRFRGRLASLLEVGAGFHDQLTGRENIFLNGSILGLSREEIFRKFDAIVAFAGVEAFLDTPVRFYSSGMYMRLAFAVAAHLESDILLVDEVLAVGDAEFQKRCTERMGEVTKGGRTILFVSHNMGAITRFCRRVIWLDAGRIVMEGPAQEIVHRYLSSNMKVARSWVRPDGMAEREVVIREVRLAGERSLPTGMFGGDEDVRVEIDYEVKCFVPACQLAVRLADSDGVPVLTTADTDAEPGGMAARKAGRYRARFVIPKRFLPPDTYSILVAAHVPYQCLFDQVENALFFEVGEAGSLVALDGRLGAVAPLLSWTTEGV